MSKQITVDQILHLASYGKDYNAFNADPFVQGMSAADCMALTNAIKLAAAPGSKPYKPKRKPEGPASSYNLTYLRLACIKYAQAKASDAIEIATASVKGHHAAVQAQAMAEPVEEPAIVQTASNPAQAGKSQIQELAGAVSTLTGLVKDLAGDVAELKAKKTRKKATS